MSIIIVIIIIIIIIVVVVVGVVAGVIIHFRGLLLSVPSDVRRYVPLSSLFQDGCVCVFVCVCLWSRWAFSSPRGQQRRMLLAAFMMCRGRAVFV